MKNPGAKAPGCLGRNVGTWPTGSSPVPVIPDWKGEEAMCFCRRSVMDLRRPGILRTAHPSPRGGLRLRGTCRLPCDRRRISGFAGCETQIAPDRQDGGSTCWIRQDRLRLAGLVVGANEYRLVVILVRDPSAIRVGDQDGSAVGQLQPVGRAAASGPPDLKTQVVECRQDNLGFLGFQGEAGAVMVHRQFNDLDNRAGRDDLVGLPGRITNVLEESCFHIDLRCFSLLAGPRWTARPARHGRREFAGPPGPKPRRAYLIGNCCGRRFWLPGLLGCCWGLCCCCWGGRFCPRGSWLNSTYPEQNVV